MMPKLMSGKDLKSPAQWARVTLSPQRTGRGLLLSQRAPTERCCRQTGREVTQRPDENGVRAPSQLRLLPEPGQSPCTRRRWVTVV